MAKKAENINEEVVKTLDTSETKIFPEHEKTVAEMAYYKAESRGFAPGCELDDWLQAEKELHLI